MVRNRSIDYRRGPGRGYGGRHWGWGRRNPNFVRTSPIVPARAYPYGYPYYPNVYPPVYPHIYPNTYPYYYPYY